MNDLYVWCMMFWGHLPDSRYTGTLLNCLRQACVHCECLRLATGPPSSPSGRERRGRGGFWGVEEMGLADGLVPMLLWTEWRFWEKHSACVSLVAVWGWGREEAPACLPVLCGNQTWVREGGSPASLKLARPWVWPEREREVLTCHLLVCVTQGPKHPPYTPPLSWSLYDRSFFWCFWCSY